MAELPEAKVSIANEAGSLAAGLDVLTVLGCVELNADITPRLFTSTKSLVTKHGYSAAVDYCAMHFDEAQKPVLFVGLPMATAGTIGAIDGGGNNGSSVVSVAAGPTGVLDDADGVIKVVEGGIVGTDQILLDISLDGGRSFRRTRLGTATSYTFAYQGLILSFGAGNLVAGDTVLTFSTIQPRWDQAGLAAARAALAAQLKLSRSWLIVGDLQNSTDANDILTQVNGYDTADDRYVYARAQVRDRSPASFMSRSHKIMIGNPALTFANAGTADTITRSTGSWVTEGFAIGDIVAVTGSASNNVTGAIATVTATVLTFTAATSLTNEGPVSNVNVVGSAPLTFAEVGATGDTITRTTGSWLADGFLVGDTITISGTTSNNITGKITALTATVLTFGTTDLNPETVASAGVTITGGAEDDPTWVASIDAAFASIDAQRRIDLGAGRAFKQSVLTGWYARRPVQWAATTREYQHDVQVPTWRKEDGPLSGWSLEDVDGNTVEHDERSDGGLLAARFTCFRSYANGPAGSFIALSLTRASESSLLSRTHNMAVTDLAMATVQSSTENAIGMVLELREDGTATEASLRVLEGRVNSALAMALLQRGTEGVPRASDAVWTASRSDILNVPAAQLTGTLDLRLGGTLEKISTSVRVQTAG